VRKHQENGENFIQLHGMMMMVAVVVVMVVIRTLMMFVAEDK
jgi:hypothetical protein